MRTVRIVIVLLALAVFIGGVMAVASAATATPKVVSSPAKKMPTVSPTVKPMKAPTKVPGVGQVTKKLNMLDSIGSKALDKANSEAGNAVKNKAAKMTYDIEKKIVQSSGKMSNMLSLPGMRSANPQLDHLRQMPAMGAIKMPDWTTPGIILTI